MGGSGGRHTWLHQVRRFRQQQMQSKRVGRRAGTLSKVVIGKATTRHFAEPLHLGHVGKGWCRRGNTGPLLLNGYGQGAHPRATLCKVFLGSTHVIGLTGPRGTGGSTDERVHRRKSKCCCGLQGRRTLLVKLINFRSRAVRRLRFQTSAAASTETCCALRYLRRGRHKWSTDEMVETCSKERARVVGNGLGW